MKGNKPHDYLSRCRQKHLTQSPCFRNVFKKNSQRIRRKENILQYTLVIRLKPALIMKSLTRRECPLSLSLFKITQEVLARTFRQVIEIKHKATIVVQLVKLMLTMPASHIMFWFQTQLHSFLSISSKKPIEHGRSRWSLKLKIKHFKNMYYFKNRGILSSSIFWSISLMVKTAEAWSS